MGPVVVLDELEAESVVVSDIDVDGSIVSVSVVLGVVLADIVVDVDGDEVDALVLAVGSDDVVSVSVSVSYSAFGSRPRQPTIASDPKVQVRVVQAITRGSYPSWLTGRR